jgi:hypothetical protein
MDLGSLLVLLAVLILVGLYVVRPFSDKGGGEAPFVDAHVSSLMAERDRIITTIRDLDFDYSLQKVPEEEYLSLREAALKQGTDVLQEIEAYREMSLEETTPPEAPGAESHAAGDDPLEMLIAERKRARQEKMAGFCPNCGSPIQKKDEYCWKCGASLS